ncbi:MAG: hypothetical protein HYV26_21485 [Candidatus Hydrogenedentes bacterium]|nr:hypothetical protein [Candidatus Hydrogenedentota bacterium]
MAMLVDIERTGVTFHGTVKESVRITPEDYTEEVRHIVLEVDHQDFAFTVGQSIGVIVPGPHEFGNEDHLRLYSIASTDGGENGSPSAISICVKRCFYIDEINGERYAGVASNYLCDLKNGAKVLLTGPFGSVFTLPEDPAANLIMIGMGTGIAPFRAFVRQIYDRLGGWQGRVRLFYGAKTGVELLYMNDLKNDLANYYDQETFKAFEAVSPRPALDAPIDLQRTLKQNGDEIWLLMSQPNTYVYVAGLERVREMLDSAMMAIIGSQEKWERRKAEMSAGGRWAELIY